MGYIFQQANEIKHGKEHIDLGIITGENMLRLYINPESQKAGILGILDTEEHFQNHSIGGTFCENYQ